MSLLFQCIFLCPKTFYSVLLKLITRRGLRVLIPSAWLSVCDAITRKASVFVDPSPPSGPITVQNSKVWTGRSDMQS